MDDIIKMFSAIEKEPKSIIGERKIDYLFHYWVGRYESEDWERGILFYSGLADWIYRWIMDKGYPIKLNHYWYKMIYEITTDEDEAWQLFFSCVHRHIMICGKKQNDDNQVRQYRDININKSISAIEKRPGIAVGEKRVDYVTLYFAGIYAREDENFNSKKYHEISQWIYVWLKDKGYEVEWSKWWHKMIYQVTTNEDKAWELLFQCLNDYFRL